ncbi:C-C motif chemokine 6-like [Peromyscus leucopus]|uniref:C-C motif chemokine 6-like n=1 Tax=Peromyscus leucopus TaxID=10041 RepID=UPI0010A13989|nr:C-C motif chemokine 6-like [Peromyscus leucopus]
MRNSATAISFFILVAVIGSQAGIIHETILGERSEIGRFEPPVFHQGVHGSSDCCFSYVSRILCSRFVSYFPTSGGCIEPGIIFVGRKRNQVCANPSDPRVQECIKRLRLTIRPGDQAIA